jgi:hypothetical protein
VIGNAFTALTVAIAGVGAGAGCGVDTVAHLVFLLSAESVSDRIADLTRLCNLRCARGAFLSEDIEHDQGCQPRAHGGASIMTFLLVQLASAP